MAGCVGFQKETEQKQAALGTNSEHRRGICGAFTNAAISPGQACGARA